MPRFQSCPAGSNNLQFSNKSAARKYMRYLNQNLLGNKSAFELAKAQFITHLDSLINALVVKQQINNLAAFMNLPSEPPTRSCLLKLLKTNPSAQIFLPHPQQKSASFNSPNPPLDPIPHWSHLQQESQLVTPTKSFSYADTFPIPSRLLPACDLVLIPALALTSKGDRLGQGGGWYDRALCNKNAFKSTLKLGLIWSYQLFPNPIWPSATHDIKLDAALTPTSLYCFNESSCKFFSGLKIDLPYLLCSTPI